MEKGGCRKRFDLPKNTRQVKTKGGCNKSREMMTSNPNWGSFEEILLIKPTIEHMKSGMESNI
ncbi:hypothetical protein Lal_00018249 [Lupinus albus]|nr:hypothetical protein Lal_00018249 [Lupinus albus]